MPAPRQNVVVVENAQTFSEVVRRAVPELQVVEATDESWSQVPNPLCIIVDTVSTRRTVSDWLAALETPTPIPLVALVDSEADAAQWLRDGAADWVLRSSPTGFIAVVSRLERDAAEVERRQSRESRLREATGALIALARSPHFGGSDLSAALREVTELATLGMAAARAGIWLFNSDRTSFVQVDVYDTRTRAHSTGRKLAVCDTPKYFEALERSRLLPIAFANTDPRTIEVRDLYLKPEGIASTISAAVRLRGEIHGGIGIEHCGQPRRWSPEEEVFALTLADVVTLALEASERFRAEGALEQVEQRFRDVFTHTNDTIVLYRVDPDGRVVCEDFNPAAERTVGLLRHQVVGIQVEDVLPPESARKLSARFQECIRTRAPVSYEQDLLVPNGVRRFNTDIVPVLDASGQVRRLASIARDVTQQHEADAMRRTLEAQIAEAQKNEALARVAAHIAHDVNNLLTVITAHASRLTTQGKTSDVAESILQATSRGRELTQQVLSFGRRGPPQKQPLSLGALVRETLTLLEPTAPSVKIEERLSDVPSVLADGAQLNQVFTNVFTNAVLAMPTGGTMVISLDAINVDESFAALNPGLRSGRWVRLTIRDTGVGMDASTKRRLFEPFFSTRSATKGTGLGLSVVHNIVTSHEGAIVVDSVLGAGTSFHIYLRPFIDHSSQPGNGQHLLLVDDHPGMARVSAKLLETLGYRTTVFDDPREALEAFRAAPESFDALLTDLSMPYLSGEELTRQVRSLRPSVPVIVSSGMAAELHGEELAALRIDGVLLKPWRLEEAVATIQRVLQVVGPG